MTPENVMKFYLFLILWNGIRYLVRYHRIKCVNLCYPGYISPVKVDNITVFCPIFHAFCYSIFSKSFEYVIFPNKLS